MLSLLANLLGSSAGRCSTKQQSQPGVPVPLGGRIGPRRFALALLCAVVLLSADSAAEPKDPLANPAIDMEGYLRVAREAAKQRQTRRLTEQEFLRMSREPGTIVLDARSQEKYDLLHVKGAINLSFPDIAIDSLKQTIPDKSTRILIYCNNNFRNTEKPVPARSATQPGNKPANPFPPKRATASLNISTFIALYNYGYTNVYELGPLLDLQESKLPFESTPAKP